MSPHPAPLLSILSYVVLAHANDILPDLLLLLPHLCSKGDQAKERKKPHSSVHSVMTDASISHVCACVGGAYTGSHAGWRSLHAMTASSIPRGGPSFYFTRLCILSSHSPPAEVVVHRFGRVSVVSRAQKRKKAFYSLPYVVVSKLEAAPLVFWSTAQTLPLLWLLRNSRFLHNPIGQGVGPSPYFSNQHCGFCLYSSGKASGTYGIDVTRSLPLVARTRGSVCCMVVLETNLVTITRAINETPPSTPFRNCFGLLRR